MSDLHHVIVSPVLRTGYHSLREVEVTIGRDAGSDIALPSKRVSRDHARIDRVPGGHEIVDLDSTNGTFLNGRSIDHHRLRDEDEILIGPFLLRYRRVRDIEQIRSTLARPDDPETEKVTLEPSGGSSSSGTPFGEGDVLRTLLHLDRSRQTGVYRVAAAGGALSGRVHLVDGEIVRARAGAFRGKDAVRQLVTLSEGEARFESGERPDESDLRVRPGDLFDPGPIEDRPTDRSYDLDGDASG